MSQINTRFNSLFSLEVWHEYYGGVCPDIEFSVPRTAAGIVRGTGLLAKAVEGTLHVLYPTNEGGPPAGSGAGAIGAAGAAGAAGKTVRIGLLVRDPYFANITEGFDPASGALHYQNKTLPTALDDPPTRVVLRDMDPALWREGAFAVVDIAIAPGFPASAPRYQIRLKARGDSVRYYVVVKGFSNGDVDQLAVQEQASGSPGQPDEVKFYKVPPAQLSADEKSRMDILATDGARVLLFRSATAVARRERSTKQIQLMRNTEAVIERLPQPGKDRGTADLIVQLSKSKP
jgi:hypothetical protein